MIWYEDEDIKIEFDKIPKTTMLFPLPAMSKEEKKDIKAKPFCNLERLFVKITDKLHTNKNECTYYIQKEIEYNFLIEKGYRWDGATIPRLFWRLIGAKTEPEFQIASLLHDTLCENHEFIGNNRYLSTLVLIGCMKSADVGAFRRWLIKHSVDNFQKFCGWEK